MDDEVILQEISAMYYQVCLLHTLTFDFVYLLSQAK